MMKNSTGEQTTLHYTFGRISGYKEISQMLPSLRKFNQSEVAKERQRILNYYGHYGGAATFDAFGVDRKLIYVWKRRLKLNNQKPSALVPNSTVPKTKRQMNINPQIINFISNQRDQHYRLGKEKIKPLLDEYCLSIGIPSIAESTIGKVIKRNNFFFSKTNYRIYHNPNYRLKLKVERLRVKKAESIPGRIQIDTIERITDGIKEYFYCAIDTKTKFALTLNYKKKTSRNTVDFWQRFKSVYPLEIDSIQTDNGAEFLGDFDDYLTKVGLTHWFTYPRCPRINGCVERYNRTVQEEFINQNLDSLLVDKEDFNHKLANYLIWYNSRRVHKSLNLKSPLQYLFERWSMSNKSVTCTNF
jgi:transposase InsO family protein